MDTIFRQPGKTGVKIKNVNEKLTFNKYNVNVFYGVNMKTNTILMILAFGMMSGGFYGDAFATAPGKLQFTDNQQRKLMKGQVKGSLIEKPRVYLSTMKAGLSLWRKKYIKNGVLTIPSKYTDIEECAFSDVTNIEHVVMSPNVRSIANELFLDCKMLKSIDLKNVQSIGECAFKKCTGLTSINFKNVQSIGDHAFYGCEGLTSITISNSVQSIGKYAFAWCEGLTSVTIPNSVQSIGENAFFQCEGLTSITIPDSVQSIGVWAFKGCDACIFTVTSDRVHRLLTGSGVSKYRIKRPDEKPWWLPDDGKLVIPGDVKQIEYSAFVNRNDITSVEISEGVESIGEYAFYGCAGLTSVTISDKVRWINDGAFYNCDSLTSITIPNSVEYIGRNAFEGCKTCTYIVPDDRVHRLLTDSGVSKYRIAIGKEKPWWIPDNNGKIVIPGGIKQIEGSRFFDRRDIKSVEISDGITSIGWSAFYGCCGLTSITIPDSVQSIGDGAFSGCEGLTSITIPDSVQSIGDQVFGDDCTNLKEIYVYSERVRQLVFYSQPGVGPNIIKLIKKPEGVDK